MKIFIKKFDKQLSQYIERFFHPVNNKKVIS